MASGSRAGRAALWFALGVVAGTALCLAGLAGYGLWQVRRATGAPSPQPLAAATPTAVPSVPATPEASPTPEPSALPEPVATPLAAPTRQPPPPPTPRPATPHPDVARRVAEGERAVAEERWQEALLAYEQALRLEPGQPQALAGRARAAATLAALRRSFVPAPSSGESSNAAAPPGFDTGDVVVRKAPQVPARVEFAVTPAHVAPGRAYTVSVSLVNVGKKSIKLRSLRLVETVDGRPAVREPAPLAAEVKKGQRATLAELSGAWPASTREWSLQVQATSSQGDVYAGRLVWR